jgi:hypothetical protein
MTTVCVPDAETRQAADSESAFASLLTRARGELGDIAHPFSIELVGDGVRTHFRLEHRPVDLASVVIDIIDPGQVVCEVPPEVECLPAYTSYREGFSGDFAEQFGVPHVYVEETGAQLPLEPVRRWKTSGMTRPDYDDGENFFQIAVGVYIDVPAGQVVFDEPPNAGAIYRIEGRKFRYFTDAEYMRFMQTAAAQMGHNRVNSAGGPWTINDLEAVEEYPLAILTTVQALWALATDASFDIDILAPDGVNIPRSERFRQLMEMIGARQTQYDEMAAALNIGISRLETYTVRRVAKMTNRLVPVYLSREFDDWSKPKRVILEQNLLGTTAVATIVGKYDIDLYSGYPWYTVIDLGCDITKEVEVEVFDVNILNPFSGEFSDQFGMDNAFTTEFTTEFQATPERERFRTVKERRVAWTPEAVVRKNRGAPYGPPLRRINCDVLDAEQGLVLLSLDAKDTRYLPYNAFWELQLRPDDGGTPLPVLGGMIRATITEVVL